MKKALLVPAACIAALMLFGCANRPPEPADAAPTAAHTEAAHTAAAVTEAVNPEPEITEGSHSREEGYAAAFSTHMLESPGLSVHMENSVYNEEALRDYFARLGEALSTAESRLGAAHESAEVYIVNRTIADVPVTVNKRVFCTAGDIESGSALAALLGAGYALPAEWQRIGLASYLFGGEIDANGLKEFFGEPENALAASCSPLFMDAELMCEETAGMVKAAAASLAAYAVDNKGFEAFRASHDTAKLLPEWLKSIGVEGEIALPEGSEYVSDMILTHENGCICVCSFDHLKMYAMSDGFAQTPGELYSLACGLALGERRLQERFEREAPSVASVIKERIENGIDIYLVEPYYNSSYANPQSSEIHLTDSTNALHEMVHVLLAENAPEEMYWMREALAEYYSLDDSGEIFPEHEVSNGFEEYLEFFTDEVAKCEPNEDDMKFHRSVWAIYERLCSPEAEAEGRDDRMAYEMAYGISSLLLEGLERDQIRFKYDRSVGWGYNIPDVPKNEAGNSLSYPESLAVMKYLAGIYGAEKLTADHLEGLTSKESIGMTWPEIYAAAREYYEKEYGELISRD